MQRKKFLFEKKSKKDDFLAAATIESDNQLIS